MIYRELLQNDFDRLPPVLRALHSTPGVHYAVGTMLVRRQSRLLAWLLRFPPAGEQIPVRLEVDATDTRETWTRWFGGSMRRSTQRAAGGLLVEEAGPVRIAFRIRACESGMTYESQRVSVWGIAVPVHVDAFVRGREISWEVEVKISRVGSYRGMMTLKP